MGNPMLNNKKRNIVRIIIILGIIQLIVAGCTHKILLSPSTHLNLAEMGDIKMDTFNLKTIKEHCGPPDVIDFKNNILIYISKYEMEEDFFIFAILSLFDDKETEYWYLVLHTDTAKGEYMKGEIYYEHFEPEDDDDDSGIGGSFSTNWPPKKRRTYVEIKAFCKQVKLSR